MEGTISKDSFATVLLCSYVTQQETFENNYKPFSQKEWLSLLTRIAKSEIARPANLFKLSIEELINALRISVQEAERIIYLLSRGPSMALEIEKFSSMGIWIITRADPEYPKRYKRILKSMSPTILYGAGDKKLLESESIGIVGSRNANEVSIEFTKKIAELTVKEGFVVVSGGSKGIDSVAHEAAIEAGGKTVAVLSDGLSRFIKNKGNLKAILNKQLVVISPYHPNSRFYSYTALERNKYIYGLSKFTIAASSDYKKGGTWSGATENIKMNWVPLFVREDLESKGLIELSKLGAKVLTFEDLKQIKLSRLVTDKPDSSNSNDSSVYKVVWPIIEGHLKEPIKINDLSNILELEESQLRLWLMRAKTENKVKLIDTDTVISSVFYNSSIDQSKQLNIFS